MIVGGGVAALESALALHVLAGPRVRLTLVSPATEFVYRPVGVLEPFVGAPPRRLALATVAAEVGATLERETVEAVDCDRQVVHTSGQRELHYDALLIAVGAGTREVLPAAIPVDVARIGESLRVLTGEIESGLVGSLAFVVPQPTWPLPAYELALFVRADARERDIDLEIAIFTAEQQPLAALGEGISTGVAGLLADADIRLVAGTCVEWDSGKLIAKPGQRELAFDRTVVIPQLIGPAIAGLPAGADGFVPVTSHGAVLGVDHVYAAGDATDSIVKYGGIAALQADAAASSIAALAGANVQMKSIEGTIHGVLLTGRANLYFSASVKEGEVVDSRISGTSKRPAWSPEAKIDARYLGAYLDQLWGSGPPWRGAIPAR